MNDHEPDPAAGPCTAREPPLDRAGGPNPFGGREDLDPRLLALARALGRFQASRDLRAAPEPEKPT